MHYGHTLSFIRTSLFLLALCGSLSADNQFKVCIDVGHEKKMQKSILDKDGGVSLDENGNLKYILLPTGSYGSLSAYGETEFSYNHQLAIDLYNGLNSIGIYTFIANADGEKLKLAERPVTAQKYGATILISIHHDSVKENLLQAWCPSGTKKTRSYCDKFHGYGVFVSSKNKAFQQSKELGAMIARSLKEESQIPALYHADPRHGEGRKLLDARTGLYDFPDLIVLKKAEMPAVLIEAGVIKNRLEAVSLKSVERRTQIVKGIAKGIWDYREKNGF